MNVSIVKELEKLLSCYQGSISRLGIQVIRLRPTDPEKPPGEEEFSRLIHAMRIRAGHARALDEGKRRGRPPALSANQEMQCRQMARRGAGLREIAREMQRSPGTVKKALLSSE